MKKTLSTILTLALALVLAMSPVTAAPVYAAESTASPTVNGYEITASDWAMKDVMSAIEVGIYTFDNYTKESSAIFLVNPYVAKMTEDTQRAHFCIFVGGLFRALGKADMLNGAYTEGQSKFEDLWWAGNTGASDIAWPGYKDIIALTNLGIINGMSDTEFSYTGFLTREQAATIIQRTATVLGIELPDADIPFTDSISDWALDGVRHCYAAGIMNGYDDTTFGAGDNYTYEQALITVYRLYQYVIAAV